MNVLKHLNSISGHLLFITVANLSLALASPNLGLVLSLKWQQGQYRPS
jgi:hypothetical protein